MKRVDPTVTHEKQRKVLELLIELYGDDANPIINALHEIAARVAMTCGVTPENFAAGFKHHWDHLAAVINDHAENPRH